MIDLLRKRLKTYSATNALQEEQALQQTGPWKDQSLHVDIPWLADALTAKKISQID